MNIDRREQERVEVTLALLGAYQEQTGDDAVLNLNAELVGEARFNLAHKLTRSDGQPIYEDSGFSRKDILTAHREYRSTITRDKWPTDPILNFLRQQYPLARRREHQVAAVVDAEPIELSDKAWRYINRALAGSVVLLISGIILCNNIDSPRIGQPVAAPQPRPIENPAPPVVNPQPRLVERPLPPQRRPVEKPASNNVAESSDNTRIIHPQYPPVVLDVPENTIISGEIEVWIDGGWVKLYDNDPKSGVFTRLFNTARIRIEYGAAILHRSDASTLPVLAEEVEEGLYNSGCGNKCTRVDYYELHGSQLNKDARSPKNRR